MSNSNSNSNSSNSMSNSNSNSKSNSNSNRICQKRKAPDQDNKVICDCGDLVNICGHSQSESAINRRRSRKHCSEDEKRNVDSATAAAHVWLQEEENASLSKFLCELASSLVEMEKKYPNANINRTLFLKRETAIQGKIQTLQNRLPSEDSLQRMVQLNNYIMHVSDLRSSRMEACMLLRQHETLPTEALLALSS